MATIPNASLKPDGTVTLRDPQHAARLFTDDNFRLAPKQDYLFHVAFNINEAALQNIAISQRHKNEIGMLVKSVDLPQYTVKTETVNQYNRKKQIQTGHSYNAINIAFHDDNMGLINQLWQNYYSYYYADPWSATDPGAYNRTAMKHINYINSAYGLDNGATLPFFNYITIYQMARGEYVSYKLINPIISSWNHNKMSYASANVHENVMAIQYEAVAYGNGYVSQGDPEGFALEHYDLTPSPLAGTTEGLVSSSPSFVATNSINSKGGDFLSNAMQTVNGYSNSKGTNSAGTVGLTTASPSTQGVAGLQGFAFPQAKK